MPLTLPTRVWARPEQAAKLRAILEAWHAAADWLAGQAFELRMANKITLPPLYDFELRRLRVFVIHKLRRPK